MSASTVKPMPTLKGMFSEPKMNHRRNFLLENKLSLREKHIKINKEDEERYKLEKQQRHHQRMQNLYERKRSASHGRNDSVDNHNKLTKQASNSSLRVGDQQRQQKSLQTQRSRQSLYQQRDLDSVSQCASNCACPAVQRSLGSARGSYILNNKQSAHKEIQTDDINDEEFLYNALKKCTSYETKTLMSNRANFQRNGCSDSNFGGSPRLEGGEQTMQDYYINEQQHGGGGDADALSVGRQSMYNGMQPQQQEIEPNDLNNDMQNLALNDAHCVDAPVSGRSNRSIGSRHRLGSRDNLRLPAYLEREQREKAIERQRIIDQDPDCPPGHFVLSEADRQVALKGAQTKFDALINELNRMPVTSDTMRVRTRRQEIEKELIVLENDLRAFGKSKVYVKRDESQGDYPNDNQ